MLRGGGIRYAISESFEDNLRRFVLHPEVRKRCTFRLADMPYSAASKSIGDRAFWLRTMSKWTELSWGSKLDSVRSVVEGMEKIDGQWTWCIPIPLRRESMGVGEGIEVKVVRHKGRRILCEQASCVTLLDGDAVFEVEGEDHGDVEGNGSLHVDSGAREPIGFAMVVNDDDGGSRGDGWEGHSGGEEDHRADIHSGSSISCDVSGSSEHGQSSGQGSSDRHSSSSSRRSGSSSSSSCSSSSSNI